MKTSSVNLAALGDIHCGHPHTKAEFIVNNLETHLVDTPEFQDLDLILFNGDFWDQLLTLTSAAADEAELFIAYLLKKCAKYNIIVRVLEGTPLHDCKHSSRFTRINELGNYGCNVKHITELSIEHLTELNKTILYLPDELTTNPDTTWQLVQEILAANGLEQVDYVSMHGAFTYQLPPQAHHNCHDPERWIKIVRRHIFINHIHTASQYGPIIGPGSFDRLKHNEEEDKGYVYVRDYGTHSDIKFITNTTAKIYKSFNVVGLPVDAVYEAVLPVANYPKDSNVRIIAGIDDPIVNGLGTLKELYPHVNWTFKREKTNAVTDSDKPIFTRYQCKPINRNNFIEALTEKLQRMDIDPSCDYYQTMMNWSQGVVDEHTT